VFVQITGSLTRNSSVDLTDFKSRSEKKKVYDAMAAASIFQNSAGVDTSRARVVPMDAFIHFHNFFQKESLTEEEATILIEVSVLLLFFLSQKQHRLIIHRYTASHKRQVISDKLFKS
jgi:hypothetical protein